MYEKWLCTPEALEAFLQATGAAFDGSHSYSTKNTPSVGEHVLKCMATLHTVYPKMDALNVCKLYEATPRRRGEARHGAAQ